MRSFDPYCAEVGEQYDVSNLDAFQLSDAKNKLGRRGLTFNRKGSTITIVKR